MNIVRSAPPKAKSSESVMDSLAIGSVTKFWKLVKPAKLKLTVVKLDFVRLIQSKKASGYTVKTPKISIAGRIQRRFFSLSFNQSTKKKNRGK
jgi:hypothetical protein